MGPLENRVANFFQSPLSGSRREDIIPVKIEDTNQMTEYEINQLEIDTKTEPFARIHNADSSTRRRSKVHNG